MKPTNMTPDQQQKAERVIAEACGWQLKHDGVAEFWQPPVGWWGSDLSSWVAHRSASGDVRPPSYFSSLDACHEAETYLTDEQWIDYDLFLMSITKCDWHVQRGRIHATAAQKAEALLLTFSSLR